MTRMTSFLVAPLVLALAVGAAGEYPAPAPAENPATLGLALQRTMTLLATSTPEKRNTVKVLFYGQSITGQGWWKGGLADLKRRFPHADIVCENRALGGFASQLLVRTAEYDLYPFYPDLLVFHVYGDHRRYEEIIRRTRERTTAEILLQTDHVVADTEDDWTKKMNYTFLPEYARKYGCQLGRIREGWKRYLNDNALAPSKLLSDQVHLNAHGEYLMAALVGQELVYRPELPNDVWKDLVRTYAVGTDVRWEGDTLRLPFEGNRVDLIAERGGGPAAESAIDGKKPSAFPECYYHARPSGTFGVGWPAVKRIAWEKPLVLETWTLTFANFNDAQDQFDFTLEGSVTGPDGKGTGKARFVSNSGRVVLQPEDWVFPFCRQVSKKKTPDGFKVTWKVNPLFVDTYAPPEVADPAREYATTVAQGIPNAAHTLVVTGKTAIRAIRVYRPPVPASAE